MAYRTKILKQLEDSLLKPIMDFDGLTFDNKSKENFQQYRWIDCVYTKENNKPIIKYLTNEFNENKVYINIDSYDKFINYKNHREEFEYFNPFAKYKNTLYLLLLMVPVIYDRFCITNDSTESLDGLVDLVVNDEVNVTQDEMLKHVNVKKYPVIKGDIDDEYIYKYAVEITRDNGEEYELVSESKDKIISIWMLILKILDLMDETPNIIMDHDGKFDNVLLSLYELFEKYSKERELNRKDMHKIKNVEEESDYINDIEDENLLNNVEFDNEDEPIIDEDKIVSVTDEYKDFIPINNFKDDDDSLGNLEFI